MTPVPSLQRLRRLGRTIRTFVRDVRHPRRVLAEHRAISAVAAAHPCVARPHPRRGAAGRRLLLVSLSSDPQQIRLEALVVRALEARGASVAVLAFRSAPTGVRWLRGLGVTDLVGYEDFAAPDDTPPGPFLRGGETVAAVKALTYRGARIGRQALSTVVRTRREPRISLDDPEVRKSLEGTLRYAADGAHVAERVLDAVHPESVLMVERGYAGFGSIFDVALNRGIPVVQFQAAHRDDAFQLKRYTLSTRDQHPRSLDDETWLSLLDDGMTPARERMLADELESREQGKWFLARRVRPGAPRGADARTILGLDADRPVVGLFPHVLWDASMFYGHDVYPDQGRWFQETVRLAAQDDAVQWVVKLHPALYWKLRADGAREEPVELQMIREAVGDLPPHMRLLAPDAPVANADLFRILTAGVTIRGTVGLELPSLGIPVLTAGTSDYAGRGFTVDAASIAEYERNIRSIAALKPLDGDQIALARLYSFGIFCVRPWRFSSFSLDYLPLNAAGDTLAHELRYRISTSRELDDADDLRRFASWILDTDAADYVDERVLTAPAHR